MAAQKRVLEDSSPSIKPKKSRTDSHKSDQPQQAMPSLSTEVDFPRGGGTSFTPLEVKAIRAEAVKEVNEELFEDASNEKKSKKRKRKAEGDAAATFQSSEGKEKIRIEHLNYKRLTIGMKIFGQIVSILPLALIVSLPNQLFAHVPITNISNQFTEYLEHVDTEGLEESEESEDDEGDEEHTKEGVPDLSDMFTVGEYVRAVVTAIHAPGYTDISGIGKSRDDVTKASKRVELSLVPERVNAGVHNSDLKAGFTLSASIKSKEDHGYILDLGIPDISGFMSFKATSGCHKNEDTKLATGSLVNVTVTKISANGRTCTVNTDPAIFAISFLSEISSVTSVLPGTLVSGLVTSVHPAGINVQVLGFFEGTIDQLHLGHDPKAYKLGKKIKARILYDYSLSPPKFALTLAEHTMKLSPCLTPRKDNEIAKTVQEAYPIGTKLESVKVLGLETERGLIVEVEPGIEGFVHISHTSDDHVPSLLASGPWKVGSIHPARVTGYFAFDGLLQLSLRPSVLDQKYLQVSDADVGEVIKGTIKKLTPTALFVSLSGGIDGVVWPNHYADIILKHPAKRFKEGASIKCRVLVVDPEKKRILLTAKKSLVESTFPIISKPEDAVPGKVTHAVVYKVYEKHLLVEFCNNIKAVVSANELSDTLKARLQDAFAIGRVLKVRILTNNEGRITASVKKASPNFDIVDDISSIEIGNTVEGTISEIHKDNVVLTLQPSRVKALLSFKNIANHRGLTVPQLRIILKVGEKLTELVVVTRSPEKSLVIVANKPKAKPSALPKSSTITMESIVLGQLIGGRVTRQTRQGALIKITSNIGAILHLTDLVDNFEIGAALPVIDTLIKATVIGIDRNKRQLTLSTRPSRLYPDQEHQVVDREISDISDVHVGEPVRGFVKNVVEHGLFVTIGREVDARIQIRELFDDYVKDWQSRFTTLQLVKGRVISVDVGNKKVEMSLRSLEASQRQRSSGITLSDLKEGQKVDGRIKKVEDYGLFVQIEGSKLSGLCHKSQLSDNPTAEVTAALHGFHEGDRVKAVVIGIDDRRISLSLKPSHFSKGELEEVDEEEDVDVKNDHNDSGDKDGSFEGDSAPESDADEDEDVNVNDVKMASQDDDSDEEMGINVDQAQTEYQTKTTSSATKAKLPSQPPRLVLASGFQWAGEAYQPNDEAELSSDDDDDINQSSKKKRKKKQIEHDLTADMQTKTPESNADFERLLLGSPNSSYLWIQYMSFQLPLSEVDKAREIARRAIKTINFREEKEKKNVWIALLNLENVYGTDESLDAVFREASHANESKTMHLRLAAIFDQSNKFERTEEQYRKTCKKFGQSSKVWTLFGEFQLRQGNVEEARKLLPRSLQSLEKRKHLKTISRFAQLEYKHGDAERGKTLFEGIVDSHPKRWDMWSVYMDMEAAQGNIQGLRNLFDRVLALKMTSHKAKTFFKKWLDVEKRIGDEEGVDVVKEKAVEWTRRASNSS
ncbi:nucleic acid-binding protein [Pholiota conissans]|uniref:Nucleic acid-binding protein n=1 Tax=Pholiota conissans TaxID=109636 RepID=A0A9P5YYR0_9AGAR|nr:nucleic acid-binding protein [Pholiota conissans]